MISIVFALFSYYFYCIPKESNGFALFLNIKSTTRADHGNGKQVSATTTVGMWDEVKSIFFFIIYKHYYARIVGNKKQGGIGGWREAHYMFFHRILFGRSKRDGEHKDGAGIDSKH